MPDVNREQSKGGKTGSTPKLPTKGAEKGAKTTQERVEEQKR